LSDLIGQTFQQFSRKKFT